MRLESLQTPALLLDVERMQHNAQRMSQRIADFGVSLRPHVKTHKSVEIARIQTRGHTGAITVSTLAEAHAFATNGFSDITYAVPIEPGKFKRAFEIARKCERLCLLTDDHEIPSLLNNEARRAGVSLDLFLKVDCGYHRCGVEPESQAAIEIPRLISNLSHLRFAGILTHAGHSYTCRTGEDRLAVAKHERDSMVKLAGRLRDSGVEVPVVSVGSTPTITLVDHLSGIDEARPGNYIFFDAFQVAIGSCAFEDCALTVLSTVVHRNLKGGRLVVDAGAIALSKDRGPVEFSPACGYGQVLDLEGRNLGLRVETLSQEHGEIVAHDGDSIDNLKVGTRVRILANHSCLTAGQHSHYNVIQADKIVDRWQIQRGW